MVESLQAQPQLEMDEVDPRDRQDHVAGDDHATIDDAVEQVDQCLLATLRAECSAQIAFLGWTADVHGMVRPSSESATEVKWYGGHGPVASMIASGYAARACSTAASKSSMRSHARR